jgi:hypothetical protein
MWKRSLFILFFCFPAWGYQLTKDFTSGFYWASLPISITVLENDQQKKNELNTLMEAAIGEWQARTGLSLWSLKESGSSNIVRWSNKFAAETRMDPISVLAVAIRYTNGPYFAKTEIVINGGHPLNNDLTHLLTTITHELGHTMGLDHSEVHQAVMAPTLQDPYYGLHQDDLMGMNHVYSETEHRQITRYVSPLAYEKTQSSNGLSCGTIAPVSVASSSASGGGASLVLGFLIGFVRRITRWFKSLF